MPRRTMVIFWAAIAAAVFLLGGAVASLRGLGGGEGAAGPVLAFVSILALAGALLVAGRIAYVAGRLKRRSRGG